LLSNLVPIEPLSQVVFVHDYLQLVFQDERFSIYNLASVTSGRMTHSQGQAGFADVIVSLIGQRVVSATESPESLLSLTFEGGAHVVVPRQGAAVRSADAFQFNGKDHQFVVAHNA